MPDELAELTLPQLRILSNKGKLPPPRKPIPTHPDEPWIRPEDIVSPPKPS